MPSDIENCAATLPGTGDDKVVFTEATDVEKFAAAALELENWPERCSMAGDIISYNEIVALAEKIRGLFLSFNLAQ